MVIKSREFLWLKNIVIHKLLELGDRVGKHPSVLAFLFLKKRKQMLIAELMHTVE